MDNNFDVYDKSLDLAVARRLSLGHRWRSPSFSLGSVGLLQLCIKAESLCLSTLSKTEKLLFRTVDSVVHSVSHQ